MWGDFIECTLSFLLGAEVEPLTKFSNDGGRGLDRISIFRGGCLEREGEFFQGRRVAVFTQKIN